MPKKRRTDANSNLNRIPRVLNSISAQIRRVRRNQILSSFDTIYLFTIPIMTSLVSFILPSKYFTFSVIILTLLALAVIYEIYGILGDTIKNRLRGWYWLFGTLIFAYIFLILITSFGGINLETMFWAQSAYFLFLGGSYFVGMLVGSIIVRTILQPALFVRLREVGEEHKAVELTGKVKLFLCSLAVIGTIMIIIGIVIIYFKAA